MSQYGASLSEAFNIIGECSKKKSKDKDRDNPRDIEPNKLNHENFENNMKWLIERYDNMIEKLQNEIIELKHNNNNNNNNNNNIIEGFKNQSKHVSSAFTEEQINQIIFFIFASVLIILTLNFIFDFSGK